MKRLAVLLLVAVVALSGCTKRKPVIALDSWWDIGNAKKVCQVAKEWVQANQGLITQNGCNAVKSCPEMTVKANACATSETGGLEPFEAAVASRLATCSGVRFFQFKDPNEQREATTDSASQWQLMIHFEPGAAIQAWTLSGPSSEYARATGTPDEIASQVCRIVKSRTR